MLRLPTRFAVAILTFAPLFFHRSWRHAEVLLIGAILTPGARTVSRLLRITGLARERHFVNYHRVLNRTVWSPRAASRLMLLAPIPWAERTWAFPALVRPALAIGGHVRGDPSAPGH